MIRMVLYILVIFLPNNPTVSPIMRKTRQTLIAEHYRKLNPRAELLTVKVIKTRNNYNGVLERTQHNLIYLNQ